MTRYIITEKRAVWVKEYYEIEAANKEEAEDTYYNGDHEWLGHDLEDAVEGRDPCELTVTQMDADITPFIIYASDALPVACPPCNSKSKSPSHADL